MLFGFARVAQQRGWLPAWASLPTPLFAALVWGSVLWLFEHERGTLQPSLRASMVYLYDKSDRWNSLRTFIWHND